ncbi:MAG: molybdenum ABC transporter ATP-binding protein [Spiribacter sp.]|jgi:molybdate transport system ATP-binding protein|nr:molybdenum ABC transporter ATP-binding protein [Spiribacter sp.]MDR9488717.1 molybdenum ABC transporter ATP-binding protein [Spiribacter sp.]
MSEAVLHFDLELVRRTFKLAAAAEIYPGITALLGESGAGKTTLLRCLAGLEPDCRGSINHIDEIWQAPDVWLPSHRRRAGLVFQDIRLFEHLTVAGNLDYALKRREGDGPQRDEVIRALSLGPLLERVPAGLSGGEAQRVALGRALLAAPRLLLLDEPLAALDMARREQIQPLIRAIPKRFGIPVVYVTHAIQEALALSNQVILMAQGHIAARGLLADVFSQPEHWERLNGGEPMVIWDGRVVARDNDWESTTLATDAGRLRLSGLSLERGASVRLQLSARDVVLLLEPPVASSVVNVLPVVVEAMELRANGQLRIGLGSGHRATLWAEVSGQSAAALRLEKGRRLHALIRPQVIAVNH